MNIRCYEENARNTASGVLLGSTGAVGSLVWVQGSFSPGLLLRKCSKGSQGDVLSALGDWKICSVFTLALLKLASQQLRHVLQP